ncbi:MAG TPA: methyltransferase domain-containing protein [Gemmataceae bacterium]|jgi:tocopherol O-methyltransferase|nr:methyltransferase domain-containing protein [Gemmataceae bacterium]
MAEGPELLGAIRNHYDQLSFFYRLFWGDHIHHGYWEDDEPPAAAQENLIARLAERAAIPRGGRVLDVGCGLGGSSLWLARRLGCSVLGITISPAQCAMASTRAREEGLAERVSFAVADANRLELPAGSFDAVWVIECSEHLTDKAAFLRSCARLLRSGGRLALCAWLANEGGGHASLVREVCRAMLCPSLASLGDYVRWAEAAGFADVRAEDVTRRVERTWVHCLAILEHPDVQAAWPHLDAATRDFLGVFGTMRRAYANGAMGYAMFTARKA